MNWELSLGFYPGILVGFRSYPPTAAGEATNHVMYLPFVDICLTVQPNVNE